MTRTVFHSPAKPVLPPNPWSIERGPDGGIADLRYGDSLLRVALYERRISGADLLALVRLAEQEERERTLREMLDWSQSRWDAEVRHRPAENIYRQMLDQTWNQVMRWCRDRLDFDVRVTAEPGKGEQ